MAIATPRALTASSIPRGSILRSRSVADWWALTKPDVNLLVVITAAAGFCLVRPIDVRGVPWLLLLHTLLGTWLVASGAAVLNQFVERCLDARMRRTARRPLAAGRMTPGGARRFGIALAVIGTIYLAVAVNALASLLAVAAFAGYLFVYTPLKRRSPLCVLAGALPGAVPPLIGWAAASGTLSLEAWRLYAIVFLWQFPHVMAIAWLYRDDYARAGYRLLPRGRPGRVLLWQILLPSLVLIPLSLMPLVSRDAGVIAISVAAVAGCSFAWLGTTLVLRRSNEVARRLLFASIAYLPLILGLMVFGTQ